MAKMEVLHLTPTERGEIQSYLRKRNLPASVAQRMRIVLLLDEGASSYGQETRTIRGEGKIKEHRVDGTSSVQVLKGRIRYSTGGQSCDLQTGGLITLGASIAHEVESLDESAFLLPVSWPGNRKQPVSVP
jgi:quercetin dioxygenase-like cupin family protein